MIFSLPQRILNQAKHTFSELNLKRKKPKGRIIVFCGAGLSAPSGLAVYRGESGAWTLSPEAHKAMDMNYWPNSRMDALKHLALWREQSMQCEPNEAHRVIVSWKKAWPEHVDIITQNVDGLFQKAGLSDDDVLEVHGSLHRMRCMACRHQWPIGHNNAEPCPNCNSSMTKPSVVFFHEGAPLYAKMTEICDANIRSSTDTFLSIGTSWHVISPQLLMATRGRILGLQLSVDIREQPELDPWMHAQFSGGAIKGIHWAQEQIFQLWKDQQG